ncbi:MAG: hypothetical protein HY812_14220, partial [Planctomycetes bacterium]|nr:hypothetical protein [Planctomycetota bacterium]
LRRFLVSLTLRRGEPAQALAHLEVLASLRPLTRAERRLREKLSAGPAQEAQP